MKKVALATLVFFTMALASPLTAAAQTRPAGPSIPIVGSAAGLGTFAGTFQLQRFATNQQGELVATGVLSGILTTATGATSSILRTISLPVQVGQTTCDILHLDLGPLSLDILGLKVDLSRVVLDITAESGAGNLLGNLLCAVAGLLDNPGGLATLLNRILGALSL